MTLIPYAEIKKRLPHIVGSRRLEALSKEGLFPRFVRFTPRGPALWAEDAIEDWIATRLGEPGEI